MSHISRLKTNMVNQTYLLQALDDMGYSYEVGDLSVKGFGANVPNVAIRIKIPFSYDIGLRRSGENFEIVADWFGVRGLKQKEFTDRLLQRYAYHASRAKLEEQGFSLVEETQENGQIRLILRRSV